MKKYIIIILGIALIIASGCGKTTESSSQSSIQLKDESSISKIILEEREYEGDTLIERDYRRELVVSGKIVNVTASVIEGQDGTQVSIPIKASDLGLSGSQELNLVITVQN